MPPEAPLTVVCADGEAEERAELLPSLPPNSPEPPAACSVPSSLSRSPAGVEPPPPPPETVTALNEIALMGWLRTTEDVARATPHPPWALLLLPPPPPPLPAMPGVTTVGVKAVAALDGTRPYHSSKRTAAFTRRSVAALLGRPRMADSARVRRPRGTHPSCMRSWLGGAPRTGVGSATTGKPRAAAAAVTAAGVEAALIPTLALEGVGVALVLDDAAEDADDPR